MHKVTVWHCDFCKKMFQGKGIMENHEKICFKNPATKSCATCAYLGKSPAPTRVPGVMRDAWTFSAGHITDADRTKKNPQGLKSGCEFYKTDEKD